MVIDGHHLKGVGVFGIRQGLHARVLLALEVDWDESFSKLRLEDEVSEV